MDKFNERALGLMTRTAAYVPDFDFDGTDPARTEKPWGNRLKAEPGFRNHPGWWTEYGHGARLIDDADREPKFYNSPKIRGHEFASPPGALPVAALHKR